MQSPDEPHGTRLEAAVESRFAKALSRFAIPILLCVVGFLLRDQLADIKSNQAEQGDDIAQVKSDIRDLNTRLDAGVIRQVENNTDRIENIDQRVQRIERRFQP